MSDKTYEQGRMDMANEIRQWLSEHHEHSVLYHELYHIMQVTADCDLEEYICDSEEFDVKYVHPTVLSMELTRHLEDQIQAEGGVVTKWWEEPNNDGASAAIRLAGGFIDYVNGEVSQDEMETRAKLVLDMFAPGDYDYLDEDEE